MRRGRFRWDAFVLASTSAVLFHGLVTPRLMAPLFERPELPIEVAYLPEEEPSPSPSGAAPEEKPPAAEDDPLAMRQRPEAEPPAKEEEQPAPEPAEVEPPKPAPKLAEAKPAPPPPLTPLPRMTMVDQDQFPDEKDNPNARYLGQKNHRTQQDSTTRSTNLVRNQEGAEQSPSERSPQVQPEVGSKEQKVAELARERGVDQAIVRGQPRAGDQGSSERPPQKGPLAMRDLTPRTSTLAEKVRPGLERAEVDDGDLPPERLGRDLERGAAARNGEKVKLQLDHAAYDRIEGESVAAAERQRAARAEVSHAAGRWDRVQQKIAALRSSLENFAPTTRVGNQAELGTRAHPFAAYIAEMHRSIHKLWAFGFLTELDGKSSSNPLNDLERWVQLEVVVTGGGEVEKVSIVRPSGLAHFDAAAIDAVMASSPFRAPPEAIKSVDGKVYLDWRFHRDDRQCGTFGVDPHILTSVGATRNHDTSEVEKAPRVAPPRVLARPAPVAVAAPPGLGDEAPASPDGQVPDGAKDAAEGWFAAYVKGDQAWLAGWSAVPLTAQGEVAAKDATALRRLYGELLREAPKDRRLDAFEVLTAAGVRKLLGGLPPGGSGDGSMFFAVGTVKGEQFVLLLQKSNAGWRVAGIDR